VVNLLSAIVWLRRQVATKNSSAIYLAAIAVNDLLFILTFVPLILLQCEDLTQLGVRLFLHRTFLILHPGTAARSRLLGRTPVCHLPAASGSFVHCAGTFIYHFCNSESQCHCHQTQVLERAPP